MKKKALSLALALVMCLGLMTTAAFAANADLPDWYFLFAIFKNVDADGKDKDGKVVHVTYSMSQDEIDAARNSARQFETYMNQVGVMRAHVDVVEIDTTLTELHNRNSGASSVGAAQAAPLLKEKVDLDRYDHVTCIVSLNINTGYLGLSGDAFENGTGHACIDTKNRAYCLKNFSSAEADWPPSTYIHEFMHFMEVMGKKWGVTFDLHRIQSEYYPEISQSDNKNRKSCYNDIILNRVKGNAETGTGVYPAAWQYPPHVLRTMTEWTVPSGVTSIGSWAFARNKVLTKVNIPSGVTTIGGAAFQACSNLTSVSLPASITRVEDYAFVNCGLTDVYYSGSEAQWEAISIGISNGSLHKATIHYNSNTTTIPEQPQQPAGNATASPSNDKLEVNGAAANPTVYKIGGSNYFKIRDVAALLNGTGKQFAVGYDGALYSVTAATGEGYEKQSGDLAGAAAGGDQTAAVSNDTIYVDGQKVEAEVYKINGSNYFKLRDLGKALNFYVGWTAERGMYIETSKPYSE